MKNNLLLHTCCGPCALYVILSLKDNYSLTVYFYNPNIFPEKEYEARKTSIKNYCKNNNIAFIETEYEERKWLNAVKGLENEPERGKRCKLCFSFRLEKTAKYATKNNFRNFATTLTISPYKQAELINEIGHEIALKYGIKFIDNNWRKNNGFKISMDMAKKQKFYIQKYCGCKFSLKR